MKTLVVWYSRHGHTDVIAKQIATIMSATCEKLIDTQDRSDIVGWNKSAYHPEVQLPAKLQEPKFKASDFDLVIIGTPIWDNATPGTPAVMQYVKQSKFKGKVAFFCTSGATEFRAFKAFEKLIGKKPLATLDIQDRDVQLKKYPELVRDFCSEVKKKL